MTVSTSDARHTRAGHPPVQAETQLLGDSALTGELRCQLHAIASRSATVLIVGETGVGKEVAAREIHSRSRRAAQPFVPVDCTAFSSELIESQLFGHVKGAFTGALGAALGFIRCADRGTLFLDEIGELPLPAQAKLLRCLQERTVVPVGGVAAVPVDLRVIAATHRDLPRMVGEGAFRQDLYYRLNVVRLTIPPLRARHDDIVPLALHFLREVADCYEESAKVLSAEAQSRLIVYAWPGNVRELRNAMERAHMFCGSRTIEATHLPDEVRACCANAAAGPFNHADGQPRERLPHLAEAERLLIARALKVTSGNQSEAARFFDVERHRLHRLIVRCGLQHLIADGPGSMRISRFDA